MTGLPKDFSAALKQTRLDRYFSGCTPAHRREYVQWITGAKRPETRKERIGKAVKLISAKCAGEAARAKKKT